jgi:hypothetical protein
VQRKEDVGFLPESANKPLFAPGEGRKISGKTANFLKKVLIF